MAGATGEPDPGTLVGFVRRGVRGRSDPRVRAVWRVPLTCPLLWFAAGTIGVAAGVNYAGNALVASPANAGDTLAVFAMSDSLPGPVGSLIDGAIPQIVVAYVLLLGWIQWRRGEVGVETRLARWRGR